MFLHDGATAVADGSFITVAQGGAGLTFTPAAGFLGTASFDVQAATDGSGGGISGATSAAINVTQHTTTTTVVSVSPEPSDRTQAIVVTYLWRIPMAGPRRPAR